MQSPSNADFLTATTDSLVAVVVTVVLRVANHLRRDALSAGAPEIPVAVIFVCNSQGPNGTDYIK